MVALPTISDERLTAAAAGARAFPATARTEVCPCSQTQVPRKSLVTLLLLASTLLPLCPSIPAWAGPFGNQNNVLSGIFGGSGAPAAAPPLATSNLPHPSVCRIIVEEGDGSQSLGSGTLVDLRDDYGLVLTNWHVVRDVKGKITVVFPGGFQSLARVRKVDADWDLAALIIWRPQGLTPVPLAPYTPRLGEVLTIAGYGSGNYRAATGRCSQFVSPGVRFPPDMLEISVEARQGDSGGPILNERGELAGVLFGASRGSTTGSHAGRVRWFLTNVIPANSQPGTAGNAALARNPAAGPGTAAPTTGSLTPNPALPGSVPPGSALPGSVATAIPYPGSGSPVAAGPVPSPAPAPAASLVASGADNRSSGNSNFPATDSLGPLVPVPPLTTDQDRLPVAADPLAIGTNSSSPPRLATRDEDEAAREFRTGSESGATGELAALSGRPATAYDEVPRAMAAHQADHAAASSNSQDRSTAAPRGLFLDAKMFEHLKSIFAIMGLVALGMRLLSGGTPAKSESKSKSSRR